MIGGKGLNISISRENSALRINIILNVLFKYYSKTLLCIDGVKNFSIQLLYENIPQEPPAAVTQSLSMLTFRKTLADSTVTYTACY